MSKERGDQVLPSGR